MNKQMGLLVSCLIAVTFNLPVAQAAQPLKFHEATGKIRQLLLQEHQSDLASSQELDKSGGIQHTTHFPVAIVDLNGDGRPDFIAVFENQNFCSASGICDFSVYIAQPSGSYHKVGGGGAGPGAIFLEKKAVKGYRSISYDSGLRSHSILKWNGREYK